MGAFLPPASIPLLALFIWFEGWLAKVGGSPLVDLKSFKNRTFVGLICAGVGQGLLQPSTVRIVLTEVELEQAGLAAGVVTSVLQVGAAVGVAAVGSVFFTVLGQQTGGRAYGNAFASALAIAAVLQVLGMLLATKMNHRRRAQAEIASSAAVIWNSE